MVVSIFGRVACAIPCAYIACFTILIAVPAMSQPGSVATNDSPASEVRKLANEVEDLKREVDNLKTELARRPPPFKALGAEAAPPPPTAPPPNPITLSPGSVISDFTCRPKLTVDGILKPVAAGKCDRLYPVTRLFLGNLTAGATGNYTNIAGSPNIDAGLPITRTATTTYQVGIGYKGKPILTQIRALWDKESDIPRAVTQQGTISEDFLFNAVQLNAVVGYGKALTVKNTTSVRSANSEPAYTIGLTYSLDLERAWVHLVHGGESTRPVDPGYFYTANCVAIWNGKECPKRSP